MKRQLGLQSTPPAMSGLNNSASRKEVRKKSARLRGVLMLATLLLGCSGTNAPAYEVYNAVLRDFPGKRSPVEVCRHTNLPIFSKQSRQVDDDFLEDAWKLSDEAVNRLQEVFPDLAQSTLESFRRQNREPINLQPDLIQASGVTVASVSCDGGREANLHGQPVELSGVGFSNNRRQALVYLGIIEPQTGRGWYILLEREGEIWREVDRIQAWVA